MQLCSSRQTLHLNDGCGVVKAKFAPAKLAYYILTIHIYVYIYILDHILDKSPKRQNHEKISEHVGTMPAPLLMRLMISDTILTENVIHSKVRSHSLANPFSSRPFFFSLSLLLRNFRLLSLFLVLLLLSLPLSNYLLTPFLQKFGLSFQHLSPSRNKFSKCSQLSCHTGHGRKLLQLQLLSEILWPMFVIILHAHPVPLPIFQEASRILFSQMAWPMFVLVFQCHLPPLPAFQSGSRIPFSQTWRPMPVLVMPCHVLLLPVLQAGAVQWRLCFMACADLLQNGCAVNTCYLPCLSDCTLKSFPGVFQMDRTVPPIQTTSYANLIGILAKWLQDAVHFSKDFRGVSAGQIQWKNQHVERLQSKAWGLQGSVHAL